MSSVEAFIIYLFTMLELLQNILLSMRWSFVFTMTLISLFLGMLWYSRFLFLSPYVRWMHFPKNMKAGNMILTIAYEAVTRILYFMGLWWVFVTWGKTSLTWVLPLAVFIWLLFVFATQFSSVIRSNIDKKVIWITAGKILVETLVAAWMFSMMIR